MVSASVILSISDFKIVGWQIVQVTNEILK